VESIGADPRTRSHKFYRVMCLAQKVPPKYDIVQGTYGSARIREITAHAMESLNGFEWEESGYYASVRT